MPKVAKTERSRPLSQFAAAIPVLPVSDISAGAAFYAEKLGFAVAYQDETYTILRRDGVELHLWAATDAGWKTRSDGPPVVSGAETFIAGTASCRIMVTGIDDLYAACRTAGIVHPNGPLGDRPHGLREFAVLDPDNNLITMFAAIASSDTGDDA